MARLRLDLAGPGDAPEIGRLFTGFTGGSQAPPFALDRPEDFFRIMGVRGTEWKVVVARDTERDGRLAGYATVAYRRCYVNGEARALAHVLEGFISPEYRNGLLLGRSFAFIKTHALGSDDLAHAQVSVGNHVALEAFTSGRGGSPAFLPYGQHESITLPVRDVPGMGRAGAAARRVEVRRARPGDLPLLRAFFAEWGPSKQLYPVYDFDALGEGYYLGLSLGDFFLGFRHGRLAGVTGVWDQRAFKATHFFDEKGRSVPHRDMPLFLHAMLMEENDPAVMAALVDGIRAAYTDSPFRLLALGLDTEDPLRYGIEHLPQSVSWNHHFLVTYGKDPRPALRPGPFYVESARC
jgi:hypothetical protein